MAYGIKLQPRYDSRKSFYGKADVREENGRKILKSYATDVAEIRNGKAYVYETYSPTTLRHIKEFLLQNGFKAETSKQIMKDYGADRNQTFEIKKESIEKPVISNLNGGKVFRIDDKTEIYVQSEKTRSGFRHVATLVVNGMPVDKATAHYLNRTWESYEYESVINDLINKTSYIPKENKQKLKDTFAGKSHEEIENKFGTISAVASLGEVFGKTKKEKNEWKLRMIKTGVGEGLELPSDWNKLSEDEKERRLNLIIKEFKK
jgi:hypothetical protein